MKERRALSFRMSLEFLNLAFDLLKRRKYKLVPKDTQIWAIRQEDRMYDGYTVIITSKEFPIVEEGCYCNVGCFKVDKIKGIIELKEIIRNE